MYFNRLTTTEVAIYRISKRGQLGYISMVAFACNQIIQVKQYHNAYSPL